LYLACDGTDRAALSAAIGQAKVRFGEINGVIHSAMLLSTGAARQLDERDLLAVIAAKADTSWNLYEAVRNDPLDFLLFYSSAAPLEANSGRTAYAAACSLAVAFAFDIPRTGAFPVKGINWGFWRAGGDEGRARALQRITASGIELITAEDGMETVERFL